MGAAAYNRGSKLIREQIDHESKARQPDLDRQAEYENTIRRNERLVVELAEARALTAEAQRALKLEMAAHAQTIERAAQDAQASYQAMVNLRVAYSDISEKLFARKPITRYEAMLLVCDDGTFVLVHPGAGGLRAFSSLEDARRWATAHDGFIPQRREYHSVHGAYYRVGFNVWPAKHSRSP